MSSIEIRRPFDPATIPAGRAAGSDAPDRVEELANSITHGVGIILSLAGLYGLSQITGKDGTFKQAVSCKVFGASLVMLYTASTLYHSWRGEHGKRILLLLDHIGIYVLIAGTYTPLALIALRGRLGWVLLLLAWSFALAGIVAKIGRIDRLDHDSPTPYVVLSAMVLATFGRLATIVPASELLWLVAGGGFYAIGLAFFTADRRFNHMIWHLFVLAGSICHYRAVLGYVMPMPY
jgi:hemolysin III